MHIWDYDSKKLEKSKFGQKLLLENMINMGPEKGRKISKKLVKRYWDKLDIDPLKRRLLKFLIWGKT